MKTVLLTMSACLLAGPALAGQVKMEKSHICCPQCVKAIEETLSKVEGVSDVSADKDTKQITFSATDAKVARQAVNRLARAGFGGQAKHDGKVIKTPAPKVEAGTKADEVKLVRLHLCCGQCIKAVEGALTKVEGVESVTCDKDKGTCTATGSQVEVLSVLQALQDAGFNGSLPGEKGAAGDGAKKKKKAASDT